jgi:hypothetical protein
MIKGLPNINIYIMDQKDDKSDEEKGFLTKMLKKKDKKDEEMIQHMNDMKKIQEMLLSKTGGTSHIGGS